MKCSGVYHAGGYTILGDSIQDKVLGVKEDNGVSILILKDRSEVVIHSLQVLGKEEI